MTAYEGILDSAGDAVVKRGERESMLRCPCHHDRTASLSVGIGDKGQRAVIYCHTGQCRDEDVLAAWGLPVEALFDWWWERRNGSSGGATEIYVYTDENGTPLFEVGRFPGKKFLQRRPGRADWKGGIKGVRRVLYRLPRVLGAVKAGRVIYIVEGERDVHALEAAGEVATCNPGGAGKWRTEYA